MSGGRNSSSGASGVASDPLRQLQSVSVGLTGVVNRSQDLKTGFEELRRCGKRPLAEPERAC
jgi:hypothetical protein